MNLVRDMTDTLNSDLYNVEIVQAKQILANNGANIGQPVYGIDMYLDSIVIYK